MSASTEGYEARKRNVRLMGCPYPHNPKLSEIWERNWLKADAEIRRENGELIRQWGTKR